jgi:transcriptional regulator with XRE-family HTH domain
MIGKIIHIIRNTKDIRLSSLAKLTKVSVPFLSMIENENRQPSLAVLNRIAEALNIPVEVFFLLESPDRFSSPYKNVRTIVEKINKIIDSENELKKILEK